MLRMRTKSPPPDRRLIYLLNVAQRRVQRFVATQRDGATPAQSGLLFVLGKQDGLAMGEAGAALDLGPPGISGLVDRMTAANLIRRRADPDDGRAWRLWLTPAGRTALAASKAGLVEVNARLTEGFSEAEIDVVARWLTGMQTRFPRGEDE